MPASLKHTNSGRFGDSVTRFAIVGHARNGSTLLSTSLGQHTRVRMFGELFNDEESERRNAFRAGKQLYRNGRIFNRRTEGRPEFYRDELDGASFLRDEVFYQRFVSDPFAVGLKIFYNQARLGNARSVWHYLRAQRHIRVVHLIRANLLDAWLSLQYALQTDRWVWPIELGDPPQPQPIALVPQAAEAYFNEILANRLWTREAFANHPVLELEYDTGLVAHFTDTIDTVQSFLGLPVERLRPLIKRQALRARTVQIANYVELRNYFKDSRFSNFFDDECSSEPFTNVQAVGSHATDI
jgi:hypothetical protein